MSAVPAGRAAPCAALQPALAPLPPRTSATPGRACCPAGGGGAAAEGRGGQGGAGPASRGGVGARGKRLRVCRAPGSPEKQAALALGEPAPLLQVAAGRSRGFGVVPPAPWVYAGRGECRGSDSNEHFPPAVRSSAYFGLWLADSRQLVTVSSRKMPLEKRLAMCVCIYGKHYDSGSSRVDIRRT